MTELTDAEAERLARRFLSAPRRQRFVEVAAKRLHLRLLCEKAADERNVAACARSVEVFGGTGLHLTSNDRLHHVEARRAARGSSRWLELNWHPTTTAAVEHLKMAGYTLVGTSVGADSQSFEDWHPSGPTVICLGPEFGGISAELQGACDRLVHIPMAGFTESLNVSVAASILLQWASRELRCQDTAELSAVEQAELLRRWWRRDLKKRFGDQLPAVLEAFQNQDKAR